MHPYYCGVAWESRMQCSVSASHMMRMSLTSLDRLGFEQQDTAKHYIYYIRIMRPDDLP